MTSESFFFLGYGLDTSDRQLRLDGRPVKLNSRYFDALALLVREAGQLVTKDRFLDEVWRGVPVTDEALTQCIRTLRQKLGDRAGAARFIETVPKHGYRFIAPVIEAEAQANGSHSTAAQDPSHKSTDGLRRAMLLAAAGTLGGGAAGLIGGLLYGVATTSGPSASSVGLSSALLVMIVLTSFTGLIGGAGVSVGMAASSLMPGQGLAGTVAGGAFGGFAVGAFARLLGVDAFNLLLGASPVDFTGGSEGALLGAAVGVGTWFAPRGATSLRIGRAILPAAFAGAGAGMLIPLLGGEMMGGSLDLLARQFPDSLLRLGQIGAIFGEREFGPLSQLITATIEGSLFAVGVVGAITVARCLRASS